MQKYIHKIHIHIKYIYVYCIPYDCNYGFKRFNLNAAMTLCDVTLEITYPICCCEMLFLL